MPSANPAMAPTGHGGADQDGQSVLRRVAAAERAQILALPGDDPLEPTRRARVEATGPELFAQPDAIRATLRLNSAALDEVAARLVTGIKRVMLVGCGDSLAVMIAARAAVEAMLGLPCEPVQSLELAYYQARLLDASTAVIALSSSGETTRTVEALLVAQSAGSYTVAVTNTAGSTLQTEADVALVVQATRVGWPTQSSTSALALLLELAVRAGERRGASGVEQMRAGLDAMPATMAEVLKRIDPLIAAIAVREVAAPTVLFSGAGPNFASAIVGAAKVKECTPLRAVEIQVEEYHHYNSQKAGEPLFLLVPTGPSVARAVETGTDAHRWGGQLYVVTTRGERAFDALEPEGLIELPAVREELSALLYLLPAQLVGYHLGLAGAAAAEAALGADGG